VIGVSITVDEAAYTIVGVLRPGFNLFGTTRSYDSWMPFVVTPGNSRMVQRLSAHCYVNRLFLTWS
jgi:hypothetical protein